MSLRNVGYDAFVSLAPGGLLQQVGRMGQRAAANFQSLIDNTEDIPTCRCMPSDSCWPSIEEWDKFNQSLGGKLIFSKASRYSGSVLRKPKLRPFFPWWLALRSRNKALQYAKDHNVHLTIRNTGHDYYGRATGAGSLSIWTHHMKRIEILDYESPTYTAYEIAHANGLLLVGGDSDSVGYAGRYSQGGGKGPAASKYRLGSDQVLEWEAELSGGGGGTYGVVVSMISKAYPDTHTAGAQLVFTNAGLSDDDYYHAIEMFHAHLPALVDTEITALYITGGNFSKLSPVMAPGLTGEQLEGLFKPILSKLENSRSSTSMSFSTYLGAYKDMNGHQNISTVQIGGRLIPRSLVQNNNPSLTQAYRQVHRKGGLISAFILNVSRKSMDKPENSLWSHSDWDKNVADQALITNELTPEIAKLVPEGAACLNKGDPNELSWLKVFYEPKYACLRGIKRKYDPDDMFYGLKSVGSEAWQEVEHGRLCRVATM
ncbi:uncharacterized protein TRUGW13939_01372 [Talaromyces rugulosus]|uniref:Berberine/berberine-like domain-containing protein n=1 Tax=Talaromyces rugulosus TaxID=121627 RepID=A0A7H8QK25_TALRU|nr:uncharacterized protein TRUGW13939_01372 [Talaromyces rugulosus]QKX54287.1 hypothetical protein TRUGW13939_01372 [Talaromyces rugulosus]